MNPTTFEKELARLSGASEKNFMDPTALTWPAEVDEQDWCFTPELISLYGTATWHSLNERQQKRLSFYEAVNFFSLNIHGEKYLISEISRRLHQNGDPELSRYLQHFIEEEVKHMMYFSGFCQRYASKVYPDRTLKMGADQDAEIETFLLFARICLFEEIVDEYNKIMAADERLNDIARAINHIHHVEESRHLAFGRKFLRDRLKSMGHQWTENTRAALRQHLEGFRAMTWKQYYNPDVYTDAGIDEPFEVWQDLWTNPVCEAHRRRLDDDRLGTLRNLGLLGAVL